jgi:hypothetical protein
MGMRGLEPLALRGAWARLRGRETAQRLRRGRPCLERFAQWTGLCATFFALRWRVVSDAEHYELTLLTMAFTGVIMNGALTETFLSCRSRLCGNLWV